MCSKPLWPVEEAVIFFFIFNFQSDALTAADYTEIISSETRWNSFNIAWLLFFSSPVLSAME